MYPNYFVCLCTRSIIPTYDIFSRKYPLLYLKNIIFSGHPKNMRIGFASTIKVKKFSGKWIIKHQQSDHGSIPDFGSFSLLLVFNFSTYYRIFWSVLRMFAKMRMHTDRRTGEQTNYGSLKHFFTKLKSVKNAPSNWKYLSISSYQ